MGSPLGRSTGYGHARGRADIVVWAGDAHDRLSSPFTFYRGAAAIMAADLAATPVSGLRAQLCGDAHLLNFGGFASPERALVFDVNDFDETLPGPWEWDVKRLAASIEVAGRDTAMKPGDRWAAVEATVRQYRKALRSFAGGQRVVEGQRVTQSASDIFLGWLRTIGQPPARLLRPPALGRQGLGRPGLPDAVRAGRLRPHLRLDAGPGPRPFGPAHRHRFLPGRRARLRLGRRSIRHGLRRPERA